MKPALASATLGLCLLACACRGPSQRLDVSALETRLDSLVPRLLTEHAAVPGVSIGAIDSGEFVLAKGYDGARVAQTGAAAGAATLYNFASVSKPVTAWGILRLVQDGRVSLDQPVNDYLRRWKLEEVSDAHGITIRRVLSHMAGLSMPSAPWFPGDSSSPSLPAVLEGDSTRQGLGSVRPPGEAWLYSGGGYALLELLLEDVTGQDFQAYMSRAVFAPLSMSASTFAPPELAGPGVAAPHDDEGEPIGSYRVVGSAAGGLYSSAADFVHMLQAYARSGLPVLDSTLFESLSSVLVPVELQGLDGAFYGLGHGVHRTSDGQTVVYHSGSNPGFLAYFVVALESGHGLVVASNGAGAAPVLVGILQAWSEVTGVELPPLY